MKSKKYADAFNTDQQAIADISANFLLINNHQSKKTITSY